MIQLSYSSAVKFHVRVPHALVWGSSCIVKSPDSGSGTCGQLPTKMQLEVNHECHSMDIENRTVLNGKDAT